MAADTGTPVVAVNRPLAGILSLIAGAAIFSLQDVILKLLSGSYPLSQAMAIRSLVALPLILVIVRWQDGTSATIHTSGVRWMFLRGLLVVLAYTAYYMGLAVLPMATTVALYFAAPILISLLAPLVLRERASRAVLGAVAVGFAGVLLIVRPGAGGTGIAAILPLLGALGYALSMIAARPLGRSESAAAMAHWTNVAFLVAALALSAIFGSGAYEGGSSRIFLFLIRGWAWPTWTDLALMAACGVIAAVGLTLLSQAYRIAPSAIVAPFEYSYMFWAVLWGRLIWGDSPSPASWAGIVLIILAGTWALRNLAPSAPDRSDPP